jgi:predicted glycosyltransferase
MHALFDLKHPAQVNFFRPAIAALMERGHEVMVTSRDKDETVELLGELGIPHVCLSRMGRGLAGMGVELAKRTARMVGLARRFGADVLVARTGITVALAGRILGLPSVVFDDTEFAWLQILLSAPLASVVCTGMGYGKKFPGKQLCFDAPPHLAYTHPSRFVADPAVLRRHSLDPDEPYIVIRVKAWRAVHDIGVSGPAEADVLRLVEAVSEYARPIVSSERPLPPELEQYRNPLPVRDGLHLLALARLYVGEGGCMAAEAACLGTPAIFISPASRRGYLDAMQERYGHVDTVRSVQDAIVRSREWLENPALKEAACGAAWQLIKDCEDPLDFMVRVVERYGQSRGCGSGITEGWDASG